MDKELRNKFFKELDKEIKLLIDCETGFLSEKFSIEVNCPVCISSKNHHSLLFVKNGFKFVRCLKCGMIFTNPQVRKELLEDLYKDSKSNDIWVELQKSQKEQAWKKNYYLDCINLINEKIHNQKISLLDVGCNNGAFMELAREHTNWSLKGIDLSESGLKEAVAKGLDVEKSLLSEFNDGKKYNLFTLFGVLEHIPEPTEILNDIKNKTNKGDESYTMMIVPNAYSLYHMFIQQKSLSFDGRDHVNYFSDETIKIFFESNGFEVLKIDTVLTGISAIKRQIQWFDPNGDEDTERFIPNKLKTNLASKDLENFMYKNNLGLRLRIFAKYYNY